MSLLNPARVPCAGTVTIEYLILSFLSGSLAARLICRGLSFTVENVRPICAVGGLLLLTLLMVTLLGVTGGVLEPDAALWPICNFSS
jgi:hypothetical protein